MVRSTLLSCVVWWARRASFQVQRKCMIQKYLSAICQWYWKKRWKWISPASSSVFEAPDSCIYWPKMLIFCFQTLGILCQHVVQNVNFLKKSKMSPNFEKSFLGLFYVCFASKWCAALSSASSSGGPEGQVARFNANVFFKISQLHMSMILKGTLNLNISSKFLSIWSSGFMHFLIQSVEKTVLKVLGFSPNMSSNLSKNVKILKCPTMVKTIPRDVLRVFYW